MSENAEQGPFYEDLQVGKKIVHPGRTVTDVDNIWFSLLTCNPNQIHFNEDYAKKNYPGPPFNGRLVVNGALVFSIALGLSVSETSKSGHMLGVNDMRFTNPVFAGDVIYAESEILSKRESKSHPEMGIVTIRTRGFKPDGTTVVEFERTFMARKQGRAWAG